MFIHGYVDNIFSGIHKYGADHISSRFSYPSRIKLGFFNEKLERGAIMVARGILPLSIEANSHQNIRKDSERESVHLVLDKKEKKKKKR